jgi:hypothetical protein
VVGLPIKSKSRIRLAHLMESHSPTVTGSYRNSDDTVDSPEVEKTTRRLCRLRLLSDDPRSPSAGIVRTPIQVRVQISDELPQFVRVAFYSHSHQFLFPPSCFSAKLAIFRSSVLYGLSLHTYF